MRWNHKRGNKGWGQSIFCVVWFFKFYFIVVRTQYEIYLLITILSAQCHIINHSYDVVEQNFRPSLSCLTETSCPLKAVWSLLLERSCSEQLGKLMGTGWKIRIQQSYAFETPSVRRLANDPLSSFKQVQYKLTEALKHSNLPGLPEPTVHPEAAVSTRNYKSMLAICVESRCRHCAF